MSNLSRLVRAFAGRSHASRHLDSCCYAAFCQTDDGALELHRHFAFDTSLPPAATSAQRPARHTQLLMIGSYAVSNEQPASWNLPRSGTSATESSGRQLYMEGTSVTSSPVQGSESGERSHEDSNERDMKHKLLSAALSYVAERGWSAGAIQRAAADLGLSPSSAAVFTRPEAELVKFFVEKCNQELAEKLAAHRADLQGLRTRERIRTAVKWRLEMLIPYMAERERRADSWPQALAIHTSPGSLPGAIWQVGWLVDEIWYAAGDTCTDLNWYTKRALLAGVYAATEAYMLTDYSPGYADTWEALDRRLQDVAALGKMTGKAKEAANDALRNVASVLQWAQDHFTEGGSRKPGV